MQTLKGLEWNKNKKYKKPKLITLAIHQAGTNNIKLKMTFSWFQLSALLFISDFKREPECTSSLPDQSWFSSSVRVGRFVLFAHRAALLRVKWHRKQSAIYPVREST